eukprot:2160578-Alexandrium_andersonii.AAC.1
MSASLVGSEMCIRDSSLPRPWASQPTLVGGSGERVVALAHEKSEPWRPCLLYTSDAADDM